MAQFVTKRSLSRRTFLRGVGATLALPALHAMTPAMAWAGAGSGRRPWRLMFIFTPNGVHMPDWTPAREGTDYELPWILEPLARHRENVNVYSGLTLDGGRAHGDGPGDHARAASSYLTAAHPVKTGGADIRVGVSVDQVAASHMGDRTRFASLELGCEHGRRAGSCDSGYSCAYSSNISWRTPSTPAPKEVNPRAVFDRLFGGPGESLDREDQVARSRHRRSLLDFVLEDVERLEGKLGPADRRKLDEYLSSVRDVEKRIQSAELGFDAAELGIERPRGVPKKYEEHIQLLFELSRLAFQTDSTRVVSFMVANAGSNRSYPWLGVPEGHHEVSHHKKDPIKHQKIRSINRFHVEQFAAFLDRMRQKDEADEALLDRTLIVYGSALGDGNRHNHHNLPILFAGGSEGMSLGRHVRYPKETPLANLYVSMLNRFGLRTESFADSRGLVDTVWES